jgi:hypothetical protein
MLAAARFGAWTVIFLDQARTFDMQRLSQIGKSEEEIPTPHFSNHHISRISTLVSYLPLKEGGVKDMHM